MSRLDPKFTRRSNAPLPGGLYDDPNTSRSGFSNAESASGSEYSESTISNYDVPTLENNNPRLHLLHNGKWTPKEVFMFVFAFTANYLH